MRNPAKPVVTAEIDFAVDRPTWVRVEAEGVPVVQGFVVQTGLEAAQHVGQEASDAIAGIEHLRVQYAELQGEEISADVCLKLDIAVVKALHIAGVLDGDGQPVKR